MRTGNADFITDAPYRAVNDRARRLEIAAGQQPRLTGNPFVPIETMTAYIVQVSLGDTPRGTIEYRTIFAVGMLLFVMTFSLNLISTWLRERFREEYA